jgi:hypothetical protein
MLLVPVGDSSDIYAWGYDPQTYELQIQFTNGRVYSYANVAAEEFAALSLSSSKGSAFWQLIRRNNLAHPWVRLQ